jgi:IS30 family transposase
MPEGYTHLAYEQRCQIYTLLKRGDSKSRIATAIGVAVSTVSRELERNRGKRGYRFKQAHQKATFRRSKVSTKKRKMTLEVQLYVEKMMRERQWSPEQIAGRLKIIAAISISHEAIYQFIWKDKRKGGVLYKNLRRHGKKYNKRGSKLAGRGLIPGRIGIEFRPEIVETRERVGDFEGDTIVGVKRKGAIVSLVDRKTKITRLALIPRAGAEEAHSAIVAALTNIRKYVLTITTDNGKEFAKHADTAKKLDADFFFANPYHAWERGLNENTNGLVRQYFPKGTDFTKIAHSEIRDVEFLLNTRPRKSLNFQTPHEVFFTNTGIDLDYALRG